MRGGHGHGHGTPVWEQKLMPRKSELEQHLHRADPMIHGFSLFNRPFSFSFRR